MSRAFDKGDETETTKGDDNMPWTGMSIDELHRRRGQIVLEEMCLERWLAIKPLGVSYNAACHNFVLQVCSPTLDMVEIGEAAPDLRLEIEEHPSDKRFFKTVLRVTNEHCPYCRKKRTPRVAVTDQAGKTLMNELDE